MSTVDRRQVPRFEFVGDQMGSLKGLESLRVRNLGRDGLLVESVSPIAVGSILGFTMIHGTSSAELQATVRHQSTPRETDAGPRYLVGLEFMNLAAPAKAWIEDVLNAESKPPSPYED